MRLMGLVAAATLAAFAVLLCSGCDADAEAPEVVLDLEGNVVEPLAIGDAPIRVFLFVRADCPVSNRYAPEVRRLHEEFAGDEVSFWLVYPNPDVTVEEIRRHLADYRYVTPALRDPHHVLVKQTGVRITPEAAVFDARGGLAYRGRIDDRIVELGRTRGGASSNDLEAALESLLDGRPVEVTRTEAVGCYIVDLR